MTASALTNAAAGSAKNFTRTLDFGTASEMVLLVNASTGSSAGGMTRIKHPYVSLATIFTSVPLGVIIFVIVFGNALVIVAVLRESRLKRQPQNWLIVSLAAADLLVGLLIMPLTLAYEILDEWVLGAALCELWLALDVLFVTASILNLCAISLDRYWSLTIPMSYPQRRTPFRMLLMITVVWLSAFAISFPPLVGWRPDEQAVGDCILSDQLGYVSYSAFGSFYIPVSVLLFVYARIYCISRKRKKSTAGQNVPERRKLSLARRLRQMVTHRGPKLAQQPNAKLLPENPLGSKELLNGVHLPTPGTDYAAVIAKVRAMAALRRDSLDLRDEANGRLKASTTSIGTDVPMIAAPENSSGDGLSHVLAIAVAAAAQSRQEHLSESLTARAYELQTQLRQRRKLVRRRERQATVVLGLVLGSFVVSWLPFFCSYLLSAVCCKTPDLIFDVIFWLGYCNSAFNPIIYNFFNRDFRRAFRRILCDPINRKLSASFSSFPGKEQKPFRKRAVPSMTAPSGMKQPGRLLPRAQTRSSFDYEE